MNRAVNPLTGQRLPPELVPTKKNGVHVVRGQRVVFEQTPTGTLADREYSLLRAEDAAVPVWEVTLAPIYRNVVGPTWQGMPSRVPTMFFGQPRCLLTFGGGGVSFAVDFEYPVTGTSFGVAGDNLNLTVRPFDLAHVYTAADLPALVAWCAPGRVTTALQPLTIQGQDGPVASVAVWPFARAIIVGGDTAGATIVVVLAGPLGNTTTRVPVNGGPVRIPLPAEAISITATASAGNCWVQQELVFT